MTNNAEADAPASTSAIPGTATAAAARNPADHLRPTGGKANISARNPATRGNCSTGSGDDPIHPSQHVATRPESPATAVRDGEHTRSRFPPA
ncbi:hypothetical protein GCM10027360_29120 [Amycolatopsis echigonensis]